MHAIYFIFSLLTLLILLIFCISYLCFRIVFYVPRKNKLFSDEILVPTRDIYEPYHELMKKWILETRNLTHKDCLAWIDFAIHHFGSDIKLILTGISMGASTVLMAAGRPLPLNVVGVLADCGFSSPKEIIKKCAKDMHIPAHIIYPFIKLGAKIFGHFDLEEYSPMEAMKTCKTPILFFHGEDDSFVPCYMSQKLYNACISPKKLVTVPKAEHGLVYLVDNPGYFQAVVKFFSENGVPTALISSLL